MPEFSTIREDIEGGFAFKMVSPSFSKSSSLDVIKVHKWENMLPFQILKNKSVLEIPIEFLDSGTREQFLP